MNLWRWGAGATSWDPSLAGTNFLVRGLWSGGPDGIWAVGGMSTAATARYGRAIHAVPGNGALDWVEYDTQSPYDLNAIWGSSSGDVWAVGNRGTVRHWTNATPKRWAIVDVPTSEDLRAVWGTSAKDIWVVGDKGTILHYDGTTFERVEAQFGAGGSTPNLRGVWGSSADDVWIVGDSVVLHRNSGVESHERQHPLSIACLALRSRAGSGRDLHDERVRRRRRPLGSFEPGIDGGNTLPEVDASEEPVDGGVDDAADAARADADASVLCSPDGFCHLPVPVSDSLRAVWGDGAGTVWAVSDKGDVLRWDGTAFLVHATAAEPALHHLGQRTDRHLGRR